MTESEAKLIESMSDDYSNVLKEAKSMGCKEIRALYNIPLKNMEMIVQALEKQIPKKPILKNGESGSFVDYKDGHGEYKVTKWQDWVCPICGWFVGQRYNRSQNHSHDQRKCNYCNECGQKIDWSDEE